MRTELYLLLEHILAWSLGFGLGAHNRAWGLGKEFWIWFGYAISGELLLIYLLPTVLTLAIECTLVIVF